MLYRFPITLLWLVLIILFFITAQNFVLAKEHFGSGSEEFKFVNETDSQFEINYVSTAYSDLNSCVLDEVELQANKAAHTIEDNSEGQGSYAFGGNDFVKMVYYLEKCEDENQYIVNYQINETNDSNNISPVAEVTFTMTFSSGGGDNPYFRKNVSIDCDGESEYKCVTSDGYKAKIKSH